MRADLDFFFFLHFYFYEAGSSSYRIPNSFGELSKLTSSCWSLYKNNFHRLLLKYLKCRKMRWSIELLRVCVVCLSLCVSVISAFSQSLDSDFTFTLPAGRKECFFQGMKKDASLEIEYQVPLNISFWFSLRKADIDHIARHCKLWVLPTFLLWYQ